MNGIKMKNVPLHLHIIFLLGVLLLVFTPSAAFCAESAGGAVTIEADTLSHDSETNTFKANGNVRIRGRGLTLLSDSATLWQAKNEGEAVGNVVLKKDGDQLRSDRLKLDFTKETGEAENGDLFVKQGNFHLRAKRMSKVGTDSYHLDRGTFTTCDGDSPSWKFAASDVEVTVGEYMTGKHALFYIKDVPVLYFPYVVFPVKRERQSGFLTPRVGNSTLNGFSVSLGYYWVIAPNQDATIGLDVLSKRGAGLALDYRYIRKRGSEGEFRGYVIYDTQQQRFRGDLTQKHQETVSETFNFKSDINLVSDRNFYHDYAEATGIYNRSVLESSVSATKYFRRYLLAAEGRYVQDISAPNNRATLQRLPTVSLTGIHQQVWNLPLYYSLDSNFTNFDRAEGVRGQRLDIHPRLTFLHPLGPLEVSGWAGYRQRLYNAYGTSTGDGYHGAGLFDAGGAVSSTLARVFDTGNPVMPKVRHLLIPEVRYGYVQEREQESLPFFDYNDRIVGEDMVTYSLTNYVAVRFGHDGGSPEYRDLLYFRVSQGYELGGGRRDLLTLVDEQRRFTDIRFEGTVHPLQRFSISFDSRLNPYRLHLSTSGVAADISDGQGNSAGLGYRYARGVVQYIEGRAGIALVKPFILNYTGRYSFDRKGFLESSYSLEYRHQCWSVILSYRDRLASREFFINFALSGIGSLGKIRAF